MWETKPLIWEVPKDNAGGYRVQTRESGGPWAPSAQKDFRLQIGTQIYMLSPMGVMGVMALVLTSGSFESWKIKSQ